MAFTFSAVIRYRHIVVQIITNCKPAGISGERSSGVAMLSATCVSPETGKLLRKSNSPGMS
jgi:hypothetical protein